MHVSDGPQSGTLARYGNAHFALTESMLVAPECPVSCIVMQIHWARRFFLQTIMFATSSSGTRAMPLDLIPEVASLPPLDTDETCMFPREAFHSQTLISLGPWLATRDLVRALQLVLDQDTGKHESEGGEVLALKHWSFEDPPKVQIVQGKGGKQGPVPNGV